MVSSRIVAFAALLCVAAPVAAQTPSGERETLVIETQNGPQTFEVEIADEPRERSVGLMYRREMPKGAGMLFDFGEEQPVSMWMANTYIPLDMLFIRADGTVSSIAERTTPLSERSISSKETVRYVLEINGGVSDALGIEQGDKMSGPAMEALQ
jgi:uncharacterized membrane protein (UPF0127 family)